MTHHLHPAERSYSTPITFGSYGEDDGPEIEYEANPDNIYEIEAELADTGEDEDAEDAEDDDDEHAPLDITVIDDDGSSDLPEGTSLQLTLEGEDA